MRGKETGGIGKLLRDSHMDLIRAIHFHAYA